MRFGLMLVVYKFVEILLFMLDKFYLGKMFFKIDGKILFCVMFLKYIMVFILIY